MVKTRILPQNNYKAVYSDGKTIRLALNPRKPITDLEYPEFYDVKLTNFCQSGCPYCYQDSKPEAHYADVVEKIATYFGAMTENQRPFQVALGGGNPNQHPDFIKCLEKFCELGITPNYTTNGMGLTPEILVATKKYCGGVAVSCHPHMDKVWRNAVRLLLANGVKTNLHIIISDKDSIDRFKNIFDEHKETVEYFVLLPYIPMGRAESKKIDYEYFSQVLEGINSDEIAFGANFYEYLKQHREKYNVSLYEPELMSKYLDLKDMSLYKSSFNLAKVN
jgi:sulfatase maturation enzyme AslB (radical SAM superfamily)